MWRSLSHQRITAPYWTLSPENPLCQSPQIQYCEALGHFWTYHLTGVRWMVMHPPVAFLEDHGGNYLEADFVIVHSVAMLEIHFWLPDSKLSHPQLWHQLLIFSLNNFFDIFPLFNSDCFRLCSFGTSLSWNLGGITRWVNIIRVCATQTLPCPSLIQRRFINREL